MGLRQYNFKDIRVPIGNVRMKTFNFKASALNHMKEENSSSFQIERRSLKYGACTGSVEY